MSQPGRNIVHFAWAATHTDNSAAATRIRRIDFELMLTLTYF